MDIEYDFTYLYTLYKIKEFSTNYFFKYGDMLGLKLKL